MINSLQFIFIIHEFKNKIKEKLIRKGVEDMRFWMMTMEAMNHSNNQFGNNNHLSGLISSYPEKHAASLR